MSFEDRIVSLFEDGEARAAFLKWGWLASILFLSFGYGVILWTLFT
ncbi:MAG: hypothetical protein R3185_04870 [Candidatus Thermoplasmatota archaeon]|nr:hypothetical protein [Candidatus Thermoplasmatota archaeon]